MTRKVMRPKAWDPKKQKLPCWSEPKIDGARAYNPDGILLARTQKKHANKYVTAQFSKVEYIGFDGEMAAERETHPALCRLTTSALTTEDSQPFVLWHCFDFVTADTHALPYQDRYNIMKERIARFQAQGLCGHLRVVPYIICNTIEEVYAAHDHWMDLGYEGSCTYNPKLPHKEGDSSAPHGGVNRIKDFIDSEAIVIGITEGDTNNNEAQTNELGRTFRTSHQENKSPNGMIGSIQCRQIADLYDTRDPTKLLLAKDQEFTCSPGALTHAERLYYFQHPEEFVQKMINHRFFPKGMKDKPRFPQFFSISERQDL